MAEVIAPIPVRAAETRLHMPSPPQSPVARPSPPKPKSPRTPKPATPRSMSKTPSRPPSRTERKFPCSHPGCDKAYFKPSRLAEHMRVHTGERPHVCETCGQSYLRASHLVAHQRTHLDEAEKPFACDRDGCGKRFWTATHLKRHDEAHEHAKVHKCDQCGDEFPKTHLLREHFAEKHMPPGSKPFICTHDGCGRTFAMKQQLKTHEKTHDPTRYTCSHPDHGEDMPMFPVWSALQAHIRDAHPPTCPHEECAGRTFKSAQRLKEHLKVHADRDADLAQGESSADDLPPVLAEASRRRRKRRRSQYEADDEEYAPPPAPGVEDERADEQPLASTSRRSSRATTPGTPRKLPRLLSGEAGKDWICGAPACGQKFKTRFARDEHAQAAHSEGKKHKCEICGRAYRRPASLKRHQKEGWCGKEEPLVEIKREPGTDEYGAEYGEEPLVSLAMTDADARGEGAFLLGTAAMPGERFFRVYDVRRHLASAHDIQLDDMGTRELLLSDGQTGEDDFE